MELLRSTMTDLKLNARANDRILKMAPTNTDLLRSTRSTSKQASGAIRFRSLIGSCGREASRRSL
jgi:predicted ATPase with chaperone activity